MPDYKNGKIYKIWSPEGDDIYIGATTQSLSVRKAEHKRKGNYDYYKNCSSKILFQKYDDVRIELIEEFPCENKMELDRREGYYIRTIDCINKQIPGRSPKEYFQDNKEKIKDYREKNKEHIKEYLENNKEYFKEQKHEWYEKNKEKIKEYNKEWYENNREKIKEQVKEYRENNKEKIKEQRKEYYENNREKIKESNKKYREANKEKINEKQRERRAIKKNLDSVQSVVLSPEQPPL